MRSCQLCGCASWGPVKDPVALEEALMAPIRRGPDAVTMHAPGTVLLRCDGCGSYAREDLISESFTGDPVFTGGGPTPMPAYPLLDPIVSAQAMLKGLLPERASETRTERLVRSMMENIDVQDSSARGLVMFARSIENEMDRCAASHSKESVAPPALKSRNFATDFLLPAQNWAAALGAGHRVTHDILPTVLDTAIVYGALEALTGNISLSNVESVDAVYWEKVQRLARWN